MKPHLFSVQRSCRRGDGRLRSPNSGTTSGRKALSMATSGKGRAMLPSCGSLRAAAHPRPQHSQGRESRFSPSQGRANEAIFLAIPFWRAEAPYSSQTTFWNINVRQTAGVGILALTSTCSARFTCLGHPSSSTKCGLGLGIRREVEF